MFERFGHGEDCSHAGFRAAALRGENCQFSAGKTTVEESEAEENENDPNNDRSRIDNGLAWVGVQGRGPREGMYFRARKSCKPNIIH